MPCGDKHVTVPCDRVRSVTKFPLGDKRSTCLVADSGLSLNFPKGTKGLTCPAGINMLRFLVADSVLSLNFPKGTKALTCPAGIHMLRFLTTESHSVAGQITHPHGVDYLCICLLYSQEYLCFCTCSL